MTSDLVLGNAAVLAALMLTLWVVSVVRRDVSIVDPWWSMGFLFVALHTVWRTGLTPAKTLLLLAVGAWAVRLWWHLVSRSRGKPEDPRYAAFRARFGAHRYWWVSLFQVFLLQGALILIISAPIQLAAAATGSGEISVWEVIGLHVFAFGFVFEAMADAQLQRFRDDPGSKGRVLDTGLWRYSRHPNYFGEAVLTWGFFCFALAHPWGWATAVAPALMTFLLLRVSGVTLLDAHLEKSRPGYAEYIRRTSGFVPRPPRP